MQSVLSPETSFAAIRSALAAAGFVEERIAALRPPLVAGEPELARFRRGAAVIDYSYNPVFGLRVIAGETPPGLPLLDTAELSGLIASADPRRALFGALAAAALGRREYCAAITRRAETLPPELASIAGNALKELGTAPAPLHPGPAALRRAIAQRAPDASALIEAALETGDARALTGMIGAARLGLTILTGRIATARIDRPYEATARDLARAVQRIALKTLSGERPGTADTPRNRFWRALIGESLDQADAASHAIAALIDPLPEEPRHPDDT